MKKTMTIRTVKKTAIMPTSLKLVIIFCYYIIHLSKAGCPRLCECKWKSGKESVLCWNANLSYVPLQLEAGTQILDLTGNNLTSIKHEEFNKAGLVNLQKIFLAKCRLKTLERYAFKHLINLVELDLSYNLLTNVPSHTFDSITELRELKINGNPIQKIFNDAFLHIPQLIRLEISECKLSLIEPRAFAGLGKSLEWLKLDNNKLVDVTSESFTSLQSLHGLELEGNPWNCTCTLRPLRVWMMRQNVPFGVPPVCHSPKRLYMKSWDKLDLDEYACVPEIFAYSSSAHGVEGKNITMTCSIAGIPEPNVRWLMKNKVIANLSGTANTGGKKLYIVQLNNSSSELTIFSADLQDAGTYICLAENKAGKAEASVTLAVSKKPPETGLSHKLLIASVVTGIVFVFISCAISVCIYTIKKKQTVKWRTRECRREDNYEKIEMNHKGIKVNGGVNVNEEIAVVTDRRNGEYRVIPGGDTDQEVEDEEDTNVDGPIGGIKKISPLIVKEGSSVEQGWNSPEDLLDPDDLHIPRRTIQETRDNINKNCTSTCGTYNQYPTPTSTPTSFPIYSTPSSTIRRYFSPTASSVYSTKELSRVTEGAEKHFPDLIESSPKSKSFEMKQYSASRAASDSGSASDINEIFCTLPRKKELLQSTRYRSNDSQAPLLTDSRYGSSGGESIHGGQDRLMSDTPKYPFASLNRNRVNKISNSYLNLTREEGHQNKELTTAMSATPLLDVSNLENRIWFNKTRERISPTSSTTPNANSYDYHAAQLERFLEEYRSLQKQLTKMKETCDNLCMEKMNDNNDSGHKETMQRMTRRELATLKGKRNILVSATLTIEKQEREKQLPPPFAPSTSFFNKPTTLALSPNSNQSIGNSVDFKNFENDLKKYLISKNLSPSNFNSSNFES